VVRWSISAGISAKTTLSLAMSAVLLITILLLLLLLLLWFMFSHFLTWRTLAAMKR